MTTTDQRPRRLDSLTGLRAFAAFAVFMLHASGLFGGGKLKPMLDLLAPQGSIGVTFFFILSGMVLTVSARSDDQPGPFCRRRFARIYPAYLVALLIGLGVSALEGTKPTLGPLLTSLTLTQAWVNDPAYYFSLNGVSWTLSCEALFYLLFPLIVVRIVGMSDRGRRLAQAALVGSIVIVDAVAQAGLIDSWWVIHFPPVRLLEFAVGITLGVDLLRGRRMPGPLLAPVLLVALAYVLTHWTGGSTQSAVMVVPLSLLLLACAQRDADGDRTRFGARWLVWLGTISYCFYLVHQLVIRTVFQLQLRDLIPGISGNLMMGVLLVLAVLAAWALHAFVERPCEARLRGSSRRRVPVTMTE